MLSMNKIISIFILLSFASSTCFSEENLFSHLEYPELQVAPRASERLVQQANLEETSGLSLEWTLLTSGAMTLLASYKNYQQYRSDTPSTSDKMTNDAVATGGLLVGGGWIAWGVYMGNKKWAASRLSELKRTPVKDKRSELTRERLAEEALEHNANLASTIDSLALYTNLSAGLLLTVYATDTNRVYGLLAMTTSMLPLLFPNYYSITYEKHLEYKRKIYAPLVGMALNDKFQPMMNFSWKF